VTREFSDKAEARQGVLYHIFYFVKIHLLIFPAAAYLETAFGLFTFEPLGTPVIFTIVNVFYFDILDIIVENMIAPVVLLGVKTTFCGASPSLHFLSFILLGVTEMQCHAVCPYSVGFFNPVLDYLMNPNISHQLHHALNMGYYTVWPWHQLKGIYHYDFAEKSNVDGSVERDFATYNKVLGTCFPP